MGGHFPPELAEEVGRNWTRWMAPIAAKFVDRGEPLETSRTIGAGWVVREIGPHETQATASLKQTAWTPP